MRVPGEIISTLNLRFYRRPSVMKLLFVSNLFPDHSEPWRGLDNVTLVHALREIEPQMEVRVLAFRPSLKTSSELSHLSPRAEDSVLNPRYFGYHYLPKAGGLNHWWFERSLEAAQKSVLADFKPDAILAPWLFPDACAVARYAAKRDIPVVAVAQGSDVHQYLGMPMRRRAILKLSRQAKAIVTRSHDLELRLIKAGASSERVQTIYNGVDTKLFRPASKVEARAELKVPPEGRLLLFVGNFLPVKGIDMLLESLALVIKNSSEPIRLALIGSGPLEPALKQQATELGLLDKLIFVGRQPSSGVARWMQAADAVCLTSHNEGVPNVVLESLSSGRAIISTDVGGISEIIEPIMSKRFLVGNRDKQAFAVAVVDALAHPVDEQALHQEALPFSWQNCARNYLALLSAGA